MSGPVYRLVGLITFIALTGPSQVIGQLPSDVNRVLRDMKLDSVKSGRVVTYFEMPDSARAADLHSIATTFIAFLGDYAGTQPFMRVAVLGPENWAKLSGVRYGFPMHIGPPSNLLLLTSRPPTPTGKDTIIRGRTRDLLVIGHEGAHLLIYSLMPVGLRDSTSIPDRFLSPELRRRFARLDENPVWLAEFAASYFATAFIKTKYPENAHAWRLYFEALAAQPGQRFVHLDDWFEVMKRDASGTSYFDSEAGRKNFGWYQGVVGLIAHHVVDSERPERAVDQLRRVWAEESAWPVKTRDLVAELEQMFPGLTAMLRRLGASYERKD